MKTYIHGNLYSQPHWLNNRWPNYTLLPKTWNQLVCKVKFVFIFVKLFNIWRPRFKSSGSKTYFNLGQNAKSLDFSVILANLSVWYSVRDFDEKTCQKETLKTPKKLIALPTPCFNVMEVEQTVLFRLSRG